MKKLTLFLLICLGPTGFSQETPVDAKEVIKAIYTEALGQQKGYNWLHHICTEIGPRPSGSEASNEAARYTMQMMLDTPNVTIVLRLGKLRTHLAFAICLMA